MLLRCHPAKCPPEKVERSYCSIADIYAGSGLYLTIAMPFTGSSTNTRDTTSLRSRFMNGYFAGGHLIA
jgi:hypothetical protein